MANVLLIEDEPSLRNLYSHILSRKDYGVETANDGGDALVKLMQYKPDVILLDIIMPNIDGIEFLKILKNHPELKYIPVLMITSVTEISKMKRCLDIGAAGYIMKDSTPEDIIRRVKTIVSSLGPG